MESSQGDWKSLKPYIPVTKVSHLTTSNINEVGKCSSSTEIWDKEEVFAEYQLIYHTALLLINNSITYNKCNWYAFVTKV